MALLRERESTEVVVDGGGPRRAQPPGPPEAVERLGVRGPGFLQAAAEPQRDSGLVLERRDQQPASTSAAVGAQEIQAVLRMPGPLVVAPREGGATRQARADAGREAVVTGLVDQPRRTPPQAFRSESVSADRRDRGGDVQA